MFKASVSFKKKTSLKKRLQVQISARYCTSNIKIALVTENNVVSNLHLYNYKYGVQIINSVIKK